jgi:hypothetical protein
VDQDEIRLQFTTGFGKNTFALVASSVDAEVHGSTIDVFVHGFIFDMPPSHFDTCGYVPFGKLPAGSYVANLYFKPNTGAPQLLATRGFSVASLIPALSGPGIGILVAAMSLLAAYAMRTRRQSARYRGGLSH